MVSKKKCRYGCGKTIVWDDEMGKFIEEGTKTHHSFPRCRKLLQEQGQEVLFS